MMTTRIIEDRELGPIVVRVNQRARNFVFRTKADAIHVSVPPGSSDRELSEAIGRMREKLLALRRTIPNRLIDLNFKIDAAHFHLSMVGGGHDRFLARSTGGVMEIVCPPTADFSDKQLQKWLHKVIIEALRCQAKIFLPAELKALSTATRLSYATVKINTSRGRWGSCSARKDINLSCFLLLLPSHLIRYVLLHELCHTQEMNHGERFWALLDSFTGSRSRQLREELKNHRAEIE